MRSMRPGKLTALAIGLGTALSVAAAGAGAAACGSSGTGADLDDAGPDAPLAPDAAPDAPIAADAGHDAADAREGGPLPAHYCASLKPQPRFCDDFDDGDLTDDWDQATVIPGSLIDLDTAQYTSPPASFAVLTKELTASGTSGNAQLRKTVLGTVNHAKLSFSAFFPTVTLDKGIIAIATLDVSSSHYFTLNLRDQDAVPAASLEEFVGATMTRHVLTKLPPAGAWTRITIDLNFTTGKADVTFDAQKALDAEPITALAGTETTIRVGGVYIEGPAAAFEARFDDVVVDF